MPNILVCGTPGTGKTSLCESILEELPEMNHINISNFAIENNLHEGKDEELDCYVIDEDKILDELEDIMATRNNIVDYHSCEFFPERWFDLVIVLRTTNDVLFPRLENRGYSTNKITENITAEIMQVILEEAISSYQMEIVWEMENNSVDDMEKNVKKVLDWINAFGGQQNNNNN